MGIFTKHKSYLIYKSPHGLIIPHQEKGIPSSMSMGWIALPALLYARRLMVDIPAGKNNSIGCMFISKIIAIGTISLILFILICYLFGEAGIGIFLIGGMIMYGLSHKLDRMVIENSGFLLVGTVVASDETDAKKQAEEGNFFWRVTKEQMEEKLNAARELQNEFINQLSESKKTKIQKLIIGLEKELSNFNKDD
jgi:hypothetical protein